MCISLDIPRMAWDIVTWYVINDRDTTIGIQLKTVCCFYPGGKVLFNVSKIMKEHRPSFLCSNVPFLTLSRFLLGNYLLRFFSSGFFLKKYTDKMPLIGKMLFFKNGVVICHPKNRIVFC